MNCLLVVGLDGIRQDLPNTNIPLPDNPIHKYKLPILLFLFVFVLVFVCLLVVGLDGLR